MLQIGALWDKCMEIKLLQQDQQVLCRYWRMERCTRLLLLLFIPTPVPPKKLAQRHLHPSNPPVPPTLHPPACSSLPCFQSLHFEGKVIANFLCWQQCCCETVLEALIFRVNFFSIRAPTLFGFLITSPLTHHEFTSPLSHHEFALELSHKKTFRAVQVTKRVGSISLNKR